MPYTPNAETITEPLDGEKASTAAAEFRALKSYIQSRLLIKDGSGNVVIPGTLTVSKTVVGTSTASNLRALQAVATAGYVSNLNFFRNGFANWYLGSKDASTDLHLSVTDETHATPLMTFAAAGNVGIGGAPVGTAKLTVTGATGDVQVHAGDGNVEAYLGYTSGVGAAAVNYYGTASNHDQAFLTNNVERLRIATTGAVTCTGSVSAPSFVGPLTGNASTATSATSATTASAAPWAGITGKPTTRDGYGITDVPKTDGTSASGTWGINVTGNAGTANSASAAPWAGITGKPTTVSALALSDLAAGTYTPTISNIGTFLTVTVESAKYVRVGNFVTVTALLNTTAAGSGPYGTFEFQMSLPVASNFTATTDATGVASNAAAQGIAIANVANDTIHAYPGQDSVGTVTSVVVTYEVK